LGETEEAKKLKQEKGWNAALKRAKGEKVRDDVKKLKNSIKLKKKKKFKSTTEWKERTESVVAQKAQRQIHRQQNIMNAIKKRKEKKIGKKGRAGFEGKKKDFLNK